MAGAEYNAFEGMRRLIAALDGMDERAATILACHVVLDREVAVVLDRLLKRPGRLKNLGFVQKVQVLQATWGGTDEDADKVAAALVRFNELRNAIGHGNDDRVDGCLASLIEAYRVIEPKCGEEPSIEEIAGGIIYFFGDGPVARRLRAAAAAGHPNALAVLLGTEVAAKGSDEGAAQEQ